jgi:hypothetical protein
VLESGTKKRAVSCGPPKVSPHGVSSPCRVHLATRLHVLERFVSGRDRHAQAEGEEDGDNHCKARRATGTRPTRRPAAASATVRIEPRKDGQNIQTLYWGGSLEEARRIARKIACKHADTERKRGQCRDVIHSRSLMYANRCGRLMRVLGHPIDRPSETGWENIGHVNATAGIRK